MNYLLIYLKLIDQIIENHDKRRDPMHRKTKGCQHVTNRLDLQTLGISTEYAQKPPRSLYMM
jgi:hypothetical protein